MAANSQSHKMNTAEFLRRSLQYFVEKGLFNDKKYELNMNAATQHFTAFKAVEAEALSKNMKKFKYLINLYYRFGIIKTHKTVEKVKYTILDKKKVDKILEEADFTPTVSEKIVFVSQNVAFKSKPRQRIPVTEGNCMVCDMQFKSKEELNDHLKSHAHVLIMRLLAKGSCFSDTMDLYMEVVDGTGGGVEDQKLRPQQPFIITLKIKNQSDKHYNILEYMELNNKLNVNENMMYIERDQMLPSSIGPHEVKQVYVTTKFESVVSDIYILVLRVQTPSSENVLNIIKQLNVTVVSEFMDDLYPKIPFERIAKHVIREYNEEVVPGETISRPLFTPLYPLKPFVLPPNIVTLLNKGLKESPDMKKELEDLRAIKSLLNVRNPKECLTRENYCRMLKFLLHVEEHQMSKDIRDYDTTTTSLLPIGGRGSIHYKLKVPGLAEHRPSVIIGDSIYLKRAKDNIKFQGIVHAIEETNVVLAFNKRFTDSVYQKGMKFEVSFMYNRQTLRAEHQALELLKKHFCMHHLFPVCPGGNHTEDLHLNWFNKDIGTNPEQKQAVVQILSKTAYPAPYLLFGPPGTGKTSTIAEAITQIWRLRRGRVLVTAPSNNAANEVARRLVNHIPKTDLLRYLAPSAPYKDVNPKVLPHTNYSGGEFYHPSLEDLLKYYVVITTVTNASRLINIGVPSNHFGYVFIDESGNCTETESLIPIAGILTSKESPGSLLGQIVLAGDPKQLGPIIHSPLAKQYGLETSMLERFMNTLNIYKKWGGKSYDNYVITKLLNNYRSHPHIINVPNKLFYEGELKPVGDKDNLSELFVGWEYLPKNKKFPMIFHHVVGKDQREATSPSWFNLPEIEVVQNYLLKLVDSRIQGMRITQESIGVITPYRQQVSKIRKICQKFQWDKVTVGSVEQFQGQERLIIIISTVRSDPEFLKYDHKYRLGFLTNPKRFNVALTRAKALVIVVGNANLLQTDPNWHSLIKYCVDNQALTGANFKLQEHPDPVEELTLNIGNMDINGPERQGEEIDFSRGNL